LDGDEEDSCAFISLRHPLEPLEVGRVHEDAVEQVVERAVEQFEVVLAVGVLDSASYSLEFSFQLLEILFGFYKNIKLVI